MRAKNKKVGFRDVVKYTIFATNLIAIVLMLWSLFAWRISPLKTNFFSYIGLGFGAILFTNVFYLLFWMFFGKWKLALISLATLIFCYKPILTFFPIHFIQKKIPENSIHVLTYNVGGFQDEFKRSSSQHPILEYIAQTDADIVCLQEYMISKTGQSIITQKDINKILNRYPYHSITGLESSGKYHIYGLACFSKYPIKDTHEVIFENSYNGAAVYKIQMGDSLLTVANIHLESNRISAEDRKLYSDFLKNDESVRWDNVTSNIRARMGRSFRKRVNQVEKVNSYLSQQEPSNIIVCGDFNDTPISYAYHQMKGKLQDAYASTGLGPGITFHDNFFLFRIDYIFHSNTMKAFRTKVHKVDYSDHYPLSTHLSWITH